MAASFSLGTNVSTTLLALRVPFPCASSASTRLHWWQLAAVYVVSKPSFGTVASFELSGAASRRVDPPAPYFGSAIPTNVVLCRTARVQRICIHCRRIRWINRKVGFPAPIVHRARRCEMSLLRYRPVTREFTDIRVLTPANVDIARFLL